MLDAQTVLERNQTGNDPRVAHSRDLRSPIAPERGPSFEHPHVCRTSPENNLRYEPAKAKVATGTPLPGSHQARVFSVSFNRLPFLRRGFQSPASAGIGEPSPAAALGIGVNVSVGVSMTGVSVTGAGEATSVGDPSGGATVAVTVGVAGSSEIGRAHV